MKCDRLIPLTNIKVDSVWEVRLTRKEWDKIVLAADQYNTTYSWVVRWCIFTALKTQNIASFAASVAEFRNDGKVGSSIPGSHHRLQLCLYGTDEILLKTAALRLSTTVTALIRVALALYLGYFLTKQVGSKYFNEDGIKITAKCTICLKSVLNYIQSANISFSYFNKIDYRNLISRFQLKIKMDENLPEFFF